MPKKTATARGGAQRNKPRVRTQKSFELVRQVSDEQGQEQELEMVSNAEPTAVSVSTMAPPEVKESKSKSSSTMAPPEVKESKSKSNIAAETRQSEDKSSDTGMVTPPKTSAASRLTARRHAAQKAQQRAAAVLITAEHYAYVRRDLIFIAILAVIMFSAIIILHFVPGIGS